MVGRLDCFLGDLYNGAVLIPFLCCFFVALVIGGAVFLQRAGLDWCEDWTMMKIALGSFFVMYAIAAVGLKFALPALPSDQVNMQAVTGIWGEQWHGLGVEIQMPEAFRRMLIRNDI